MEMVGEVESEDAPVEHHSASSQQVRDCVPGGGGHSAGGGCGGGGGVWPLPFVWLARVFSWCHP